ncbi:MAG TPA: hypothetical protein VEI24_02410, partial [Nitrospiria bacterium]|nr:hypothetical protein [Nitrospiria bacterium]
MDRKAWLLSGLLLAWVGAVVYALSIWPEDRRVPLKYDKGRPAAATSIRHLEGAPSGELADLIVRKNQLTARPEPPAAIARDLFVSV